MRAALEFRVDQGGEADLIEHLVRCNGDFVPPRKDIPGYVREHLRSATRFEAWSDGALVGLVAAYLNPATGRTAFVTNASVLPQRMREGIATRLFRLCAGRAAAVGLLRLRLDVDGGNLPARRLYESLGFRAVSRSDSSATLELLLPSVDPGGFVA